MKNDLSKYLRLAEEEDIVITRHGKPAGLPLIELNRTAIHLLCQKIGVVNTARFLNQFTSGYGDYTIERDVLIDDLTVDTIVAEITRRRSQSTE